MGTIYATSFPGSLSFASLGRWKEDPGCDWSRDYPQSGCLKICWPGGVAECFVQEFCLLLLQTLWVS